MMSPVGEWRCDALSSGAKRSRKWCKAFPQVVQSVPASGAKRSRKWCKEVSSLCHISRNRRRIKANEPFQFCDECRLYQALGVNPS